MINVSDAIESAFKSDDFIGGVTFTIGADSYTASNILNNSTTITESISSSEDIDFRVVEKSCLETSLINIDEDIKELKGKTLTIKQTVLNTDIPLGVYTIVDAVYDGDYLYEITAYDNLYKFEVDVSDWWNTEVTFPITIRNLLISLCNKVGVSYDLPLTFTNSAFEVSQNIYVEEVTGTEFLGYIQEVCGGFFKPDRTGVLKFIQLAFLSENPLYPALDLYPSNNLYPKSIYDASSADPVITYTVPLTMESLTMADYEVQRITGLQVRVSEEDIGVFVGSDTNVYVIEGNPLLYSFSGTAEDELVVNNILEVIAEVSYIPISTKVKAQPYVEVGDLIRFESYEGKEAYAPLLNRTMGGFLLTSDKIDIKGTEKRDNKIKAVNKLTKILNQRYHNLTNTVSELNSTIGSVETDISDLEKRVTTNESTIQQTPDNIMATVTQTLEGYVTTETLGATLNQTASEIIASIWSSEQGQEIINALLTLNRYGLTVSIADGASRLNGEGLLVLKQVGNEYYVVAKFTKEDSYTNNLTVATYLRFGAHRWEAEYDTEYDGVSTQGTGAYWTGPQEELKEVIGD